ncbi:MAG: HAMP domain-containing protein [Nitrospinae bacterium]|nr:HAMP domain-containing protein [Nitrospinota bacterium]
MKELVFLAAVILAEVINMVVSYSKTMRLQFKYHTSALLGVAEGDFARRVPVATNDEFGLIGRYINAMIGTLRNRTTEKQLAEDAAKLKDKFVSLVAHDLRTPFNSILGLLKIAERDEETPMDKKHKNLVAKAISSSEMLVKTIDQLLDITMLQSGKIQVEPRYFRTRDLAQEGIERVSSSAAQKGITIVNSVPASNRIFADPVLVGEIFTNLFSNGIKFCKSGDTITVFIPEESPTTISVRDTGMGIPRELLPDIFKAEVKTSSTGTAGEKGTGLGLPFCADIMRAHGGDITVKSEPGWGALFTLNFPAVEPRVLVCLNDQSSRSAVLKSLDGAGLKGVEAVSPEEAERLALESPPHLAVVEVGKIGFNGLGAIAKFRENEKTSKLRVLVVMSADGLADKMAALKLKVVGMAEGAGGHDAIMNKIFLSV